MLLNLEKGFRGEPVKNNHIIFEFQSYGRVFLLGHEARVGRGHFLLKLGYFSLKTLSYKADILVTYEEAFSLKPDVL